MKPNPQQELSKPKIQKTSFVPNKFSTDLWRNICVPKVRSESKSNISQLVCTVITFPIDVRNMKTESRQKMHAIILSVP